MKNKKTAQEVFGSRASLYVSSETHSDPVVLGRVVELLQLEPDSRVLDIGTGTGHTAFAAAPYAKEIVGLDLTPEMLEEAENLQVERGIENVQFRIGDVHDLPFEDGCFQRVTCRRAAHHFLDIGGALSEISRVMPRGGRLVVDDRSVPEDEFVDGVMNQLDTYHDRSHVRQYRPSEWDDMLGLAGFSVESIEPYTQHRPISSLTEKVVDEDVNLIHSVIDSLNEEEKVKLNLKVLDGTVFTDHWYVTIAACRQ